MSRNQTVNFQWDRARARGDTERAVRGATVRDARLPLG